MNQKKLFSLLNENNVKYVVIGASAMPVHGYSRHTRDIDIFIEATDINVQHLRRALEEFGYDLLDVSNEEFLEKKILLRQYIVEADFHPHVKGTDWKKIWDTKVKENFADVPVYFASLDELIKMKKAAGRTKDLEDLKYLNEIKKIRKRGK